MGAEKIEGMCVRSAAAECSDWMRSLVFLQSPQSCPRLHRIYTDSRRLALARDRSKVQSQRKRKAFGHESVRGSLPPVRWHGVEECHSERGSASHAGRLPPEGARPKPA